MVPPRMHKPEMEIAFSVAHRPEPYGEDTIPAMDIRQYPNYSVVELG
jgi:hypothetical protein